MANKGTPIANKSTVNTTMIFTSTNKIHANAHKTHTNTTKTTTIRKLFCASIKKIDTKSIKAYAILDSIFAS